MDFYLDWLSFTISAELAERLGSNIEEITGYFGMLSDSFEGRKSGFLGWERSASLFPGGVVAWGGQGGTVYVSLSAQGLGYMRECLDLEGKTFESWLALLYGVGVRVRRIDFAFDDRTGQLDLDTVAQAWHDGNVVTRARKMVDIQEHYKGNSRRGGRTLYFGSRKSERMARFYDKAAQLLGKYLEEDKENRIDDEEAPNYTHWLRVECEIKADSATECFSKWAETGFISAYAAGVLRGVVSFVNGDSCDSNKSRRETVGWWKEFTEGFHRQSIELTRAVRTINDVERWLVESVSTSLALLIDCYSWERLQLIAQIGREKMQPRHVAILNMSKGLLAC